MSGAEMRFLCTQNMGTSEVAAGIWRMRPKSFADAFEGGFRVGQLDIKGALRAFCRRNGHKRFEALNIPLSVVVTDFYDEKERLITSGDLFDAIGASAAIPAIFQPVKCDGRICIGWGCRNPVPFDHLHGLADITLAIDVVGGPIGEPTKIPVIWIRFCSKPTHDALNH